MQLQKGWFLLYSYIIKNKTKSEDDLPLTYTYLLVWNKMSLEFWERMRIFEACGYSVNVITKFGLLHGF